MDQARHCPRAPDKTQTLSNFNAGQCDGYWTCPNTVRVTTNSQVRAECAYVGAQEGATDATATPVFALIPIATVGLTRPPTFVEAPSRR